MVNVCLANVVKQGRYNHAVYLKPPFYVGTHGNHLLSQHHGGPVDIERMLEQAAVMAQMAVNRSRSLEKTRLVEVVDHTVDAAATGRLQQ